MLVLIPSMLALAPKVGINRCNDNTKLMLVPCHLGTGGLVPSNVGIKPIASVSPSVKAKLDHHPNGHMGDGAASRSDPKLPTSCCQQNVGTNSCQGTRYHLENKAHLSQWKRTINF